MEAFRTNLQTIRQRVEQAAKRSGRTSDAIKIIGVTKYVDVEMTRQLVEAGCHVLGESRPQLLWEKAAAMSDLDVEWHLIGHLQRNKAKRTIEYATLIHSVDSERLLTELNRLGKDSSRTVNVLLEVNVSGESAKHGIQPDDLPGAIGFCGDLDHVRVQGLMCMAGLGSSTDETRREFESLRELSTRPIDLPDNVILNELSMGMSGDFELAIEEGATMVRIGSLLFDGIER